ncbi:MAG: UDP-N-acetyl-D-mannosamine dehydrogenase [Spirochaetales bacterium]|nr:UDP-N-acetyl-D-mannosamine dehydrogenase [Spirochaetales bacterium]
MIKTDKTICVMGLGYIGLPTAALLASQGYRVHGVDVHQRIVDQLNRGEIHIVEPDLDGYVKKAVESGRFNASLEPTQADVFMICVPTPFHRTGKDGIPQPDLSYVIDAAKKIAPFLKEGNGVILESTSPVGSTEKVIDAVKEVNGITQGVHFAYCPERVLPGRIMTELIENDRIVGGVDQESTESIASFYSHFVKGEVLKTDARTAEMCKLVENASRDSQIAFANELSLICDEVKVDVWELINLANHHPRVNILQPGCGVGGHCIAVDPWFLVSQSPQNARLIRAAREVNDGKPDWVVKKVQEKAVDWREEHGHSARIACMGLSFKPDIDDLRESPALRIAQELTKTGLDVVCCEPHVENIEGLNLVPCDEIYDRADIFVYLVAHSVFKDLITSDGVNLDFCGLKAFS